MESIFYGLLSVLMEAIGVQVLMEAMGVHALLETMGVQAKQAFFRKGNPPWTHFRGIL